MFHILAIVAGLGTMVYTPIPQFDTLEECQAHLTSQSLLDSVAGLKAKLAEAGHDDVEVTVVCKPISDGSGLRDAGRTS